MVAVDWSRGDLYHALTVYQLDPNSFEVRGTLDGVTGGKLDLQYYGDTRMGAELTTVGDHGWDGSAALRIVHTVSDYTGTLLTEPLFTGYVDSVSWEDELDGCKRSWTLKSALWALETTYVERGLSFAKGTKALDMCQRFCRWASQKVRVESSANEYVFGGNKVYEAGKSFLSCVLDICDAANNRLSVDANGVVTITGYKAPSTLAADWTADERSARGTVIGPVKGDVGGLDAPARVIVHGESGDSKVTGIAEVAQGAASSAGVRGFRRDRYESVTDLSPFGIGAAQSKARALLANDLADVPSISHGLLYQPLREGSIERLTRRDGTTARWMVSGASLDLAAWTWELDLKGGWQ